MAKEKEPMAGDNGGDELTPAEAKALKFHHYDAISRQLETLKREQTEYKRLRKLAKADQIILSDIDFMLKCAEIEDPTILTDRIKREAEIASWFALPIDFQPNMFDVGREPINERAKREGYAAGYGGEDPTPPYDETSKQGQAWLKSWHQAQSDRRAAMEAAMTKKNAAKAENDELIAGNDDEDPFDTEGHLEEELEQQAAE